MLTTFPAMQHDPGISKEIRLLHYGILLNMPYWLCILKYTDHHADGRITLYALSLNYHDIVYVIIVCRVFAKRILCLVKACTRCSFLSSYKHSTCYHSLIAFHSYFRTYRQSY